MPSREWLLRIHDIIAAAMENIQSTQFMTFEQFEMAESLFIKGILYNFIIIGEAAINVPEEIQIRYQKIPWRLMSDMRNVMAHEYFQVNLRRVWKTIRIYLPPLIEQLQDLLEREGAINND
ncbi:MAG: DUF86 domain-containing protein [Hormoscilla sp. GUM202]|nr:DUF86 domain-containing protein [Hormoscilla sp. GUM202]